MNKLCNDLKNSFDNSDVVLSFMRPLSTATLSLSFFGTRNVTYNGETIPLERIAKTIHEASLKVIKENPASSNMNEYFTLRNIIGNIYAESNNDLKTKSFITRFFVFLREDVFGMSAKRHFPMNTVKA